MKKIFGIAFVMALLAGGMSANAQTSTSTNNVKTEQSDRNGKSDRHGKHDRHGKKGKKEGARNHHKKGHRADLFAGITLGTEQQAQLKTLKDSRKAARKEGKKQQMTHEERTAARAAFDAKVKEILTPDQWTVYQKNVEARKADRQNRQKKNS